MKKIAIILLASIAMGCSKPEIKKQCEDWEVSEYAKEGKVYISQPIYKKMRLCEDNIKPTGATYIYYEIGNVKYYRQMIKKI
jgi:hypothetical protein